MFFIFPQSIFISTNTDLMQELTSERDVKIGLRLMAFIRKEVKDERVVTQIANYCFERLAVAESKFKMLGESTVLIYLTLIASSIIKNYQK